MVGRLVAVDVAAQHALAGDIFGFGEELVGHMHGEEGIQLPHKSLFTSHQLHHAVHIVGDIETVVPSVALYESLAAGGEEAVGELPTAVAVASTNKSVLIHVAVT